MVIQGHEMNERIKQLAEQAGFKVNWQHEDIQAIKMARFEKFAELIVLDLLKKIENEASTYAEPVWALELVNDIKDAYGIE